MKSSAAYKDRFLKYQENYSQAVPDPVDPVEMAGKVAQAKTAATQKTALVRKERYNDHKTTQSVSKS